MLILTPNDGNEEKELKKGFVGVRLSRFINALQKNPFYAPQMADLQQKKSTCKIAYDFIDLQLNARLLS